jgi:signal transduction histidine kinase
MSSRSEIGLLQEELRLETSESRRAGVLIKLAELYWQNMEYSQCKRYAETACYYADRSGAEEQLAVSYYLIGLADNYLNLYDEALENHEKALQLNKKLGIKKSVAEGYNNIGQIYLNIGDLAKAEQCFEQSIKWFECFSRGYNNLAVVLIRRERYREALDYMLRGLELIESSDSPDKHRSHVIAVINISEIYLKLGEYSTAEEYALKGMELSADRHDDTRIYGIMAYGNLLLQQDKSTEAKRHLIEALELAEKQENREISKELYLLLSHCCELSGEYKQSLDYLKRHIELEKKIYQESLSNRLSQIQRVYEEENEQLRAQQMIEKASRIATIGAMSAAITHEINQPLCAVKVSADAILYWKKRRQISFPDDIEESLKTITEGADLINEIIQHVRSFWRPEDESEGGLAEVNSTILKALGLLERQIFSHGIFLEQDFCDQGLQVKILPVHLEQVIINIVVNAVHALDECGKQHKILQIRTFEQTKRAVIEISDNACGVAAELQEKIFDPFYTTKRDGKGMGLGLAIVSNYLKKYGGEIKLSGNEQGGASFRVFLPLYKEQS